MPTSACGQGRGVVDAVPHHGHHFARGLEFRHFFGLVAGEHFGQHVLDADALGHGRGGHFIVAAQKEDFQPHALQRGHGLGGLGLDGIRGGDHPHGFTGDGQEDGGFALPGQLVLVGGEGFRATPLPARKVRFPRRVSWPSIVASTPRPGTAWKSSTRGRARFWALAAWVMASARGCSDFSSRAAAWARTASALQRSQVWTSVTWGAPRVRVPVLSKTTVVRR